jgi:Protein of unknown function (DUF2975)
LHVLSWIVFIGICIKAGTLLFSYLVSMFWNEQGAKNLYLGLDLSQLKMYSNTAYSIMAFFVLAIFVAEALLFYVVLQIFKKINFVNPFHETIGQLIKKMSVVALIIGLLSVFAVVYAKRHFSQGMQFPHLTTMIDQGEAFLFFAGILFFISVLFTRGVELQKENELTV